MSRKYRYYETPWTFSRLANKLPIAGGLLSLLFAGSHLLGAHTAEHDADRKNTWEFRSAQLAAQKAGEIQDALTNGYTSNGKPIHEKVLTITPEPLFLPSRSADELYAAAEEHREKQFAHTVAGLGLFGLAAALQIQRAVTRRRWEQIPTGGLDIVLGPEVQPTASQEPVAVHYSNAPLESYQIGSGEGATAVSVLAGLSREQL